MSKSVLRALSASFFIALLLVGGCARVPKQTLPVATPTGAGVYHTVERGQTLYRIAKMYGVDVPQLMRANHIDNPSQLETGRKLWIPRSTPTAIIPYEEVKGPEPVSLEEAQRIIGPKSYLYQWRTITVHHSATHNGGAKAFDRDHRRRKMGGLFYHFVIGNGSSTEDGSIETGFRWRRQIKANRPYDIQICLVGDFSREHVSEAQLNSLTNLIKALQEQYGISTSSIRMHRNVRESKPTECPGKNFPFSELIRRLNS